MTKGLHKSWVLTQESTIIPVDEGLLMDSGSDDEGGVSTKFRGPRLRPCPRPLQQRTPAVLLRTLQRQRTLQRPQLPPAVHSKSVQLLI